MQQKKSLKGMTWHSRGACPVVRVFGMLLGPFFSSAEFAFVFRHLECCLCGEDNKMKDTMK
jgi:hypothetical protein